MVECVSFMNLNMILSLVLFLLSVLLPFFQVLFAGKRYKFQNIPEMMLKYALFFNVGCLFITGAAGQFLYAQDISSCIGWSWSPFQHELAFSELSLGILGLLSPIFHRDFWLATIIGASVWLFGASAVHLYYLMQGNEALLNASFVIFWNVFIALWLITFYCILARTWTKVCSLLSIGYCKDKAISPKISQF